MANRIINELSAAPLRQILRPLMMLALIFLSINIIPYLFEDNIYPIYTLASSVTNIILSILALYIAFTHNRWYIYIFSGFLLSISFTIIPLLTTYGYLNVLKAYSIPLTPFITEIILFLCLITVVYTILNFKK
ncbi:hypothetical protein [Gemella sp. Musashino-2025]